MLIPEILLPIHRGPGWVGDGLDALLVDTPRCDRRGLVVAPAGAAVATPWLGQPRLIANGLNTAAQFHLHREARDTLTWSKQFPATGVTA